MIISMSKKIQTKRLKGKSTVDYIFEKGVIAKSENLLLKYVLEHNTGVYRSGVSVAKKRFKKAIDRNHIKRYLRLAIAHLNEKDLFEGSGMLVYKGGKNPSLSQLNLEVYVLFDSLKN